MGPNGRGMRKPNDIKRGVRLLQGKLNVASMFRTPRGCLVVLIKTFSSPERMEIGLLYVRKHFGPWPAGYS